MKIYVFFLLWLGDVTTKYNYGAMLYNKQFSFYCTYIYIFEFKINDCFIWT